MLGKKAQADSGFSGKQCEYSMNNKVRQTRSYCVDIRDGLRFVFLLSTFHLFSGWGHIYLRTYIDQLYLIRLLFLWPPYQIMYENKFSEKIYLYTPRIIVNLFSLTLAFVNDSKYSSS